MSHFNSKAVSPTKTTNLAGGAAYQQAPELELASLLLTSFVQDKFYKTADSELARLRELIAACEKKFVAQAAVYARQHYGMRSISHVVASELAAYLGGQDWAKDFYSAVVRRPDDITEILAYHTGRKEKVSNAMKKGLAASFRAFTPYQLGKYRGEGKGWKLVDAVNMLHPIPSPRNGEALTQLINGTLRATDTWESELSAAGQAAAGDQDAKLTLKAEAWERLLLTDKLPYFALLRNLRNLIEQAPTELELALKKLVDPILIKKSLVLPFRFITAYDEIVKLGGSPAVRRTMMALNQAVELSLSNVPVLAGRTLVVLDVSGSMTHYKEGFCAKVGSLFAAVLLKQNDADLITFSTGAQYVNVNPLDTAMTLATNIPFVGGGTNFAAAFERATGVYDRIVLLSDMQGWTMTANGISMQSSPVPAYNAYCQRTGAKPFIYSFDLAGHGTMQFPKDRVCCVAGFSEKIFDLMPKLEQDRNALLTEIRQVSFTAPAPTAEVPAE